MTLAKIKKLNQIRPLKCPSLLLNHRTVPAGAKFIINAISVFYACIGMLNS